MSDFVGMIFILFVGVAYGRIAFRRPANPPGLASK